MMTTDEIVLVRSGFDRLAPTAQEVGFAFYHTLFTLDPALRPLFRGDIRRQADHLMRALAMVVRSLDDLAPVMAQVEALGRRHAGFGVKPQHFETVGAALLLTLEAELGTAFTPGARAAWTGAYSVLADVMIGAMATRAPGHSSFSPISAEGAHHAN